jgi:methionyl-tRNA formyltransferase
MRTVYLGTAEFAVVILRRLADSPHRPALVITRPDRPRGRGRRLAAPPVAQAARELGLPLAQPPTVNDEGARAQIAAARPQALIVCAFGALIREPLLSSYEILNVHPSLLPRWRGAAPIERAIMAGDQRTGVSIIHLTAGLDSGPVLLQESLAVGADDFGALWVRLAELGATLLLRALDQRPEPVEQPEEGVTYAEKILPEDRRLDPGRPAAELERVVRALHPHIGAQLFTAAEEPALGVRQARAVERDDLPTGSLCLAGERPVLGCGVGALELLRVQPAGRREMSGEDYLRGLRR